MKIFMQINALEDCHKLQSDFDDFVEWSQSLGLTLNFDKCHTMTSSRKLFFIKLLYELSNSTILRVKTFFYLGFNLIIVSPPDLMSI